MLKNIHLNSILAFLLICILIIGIKTETETQTQTKPKISLPLTATQYEALSKIIQKRGLQQGQKWVQFQAYIKDLALPSQIQVPLIQFLKLTMQKDEADKASLDKKQSEALQKLFTAVSQKALESMVSTGKQLFDSTKKSIDNVLVSIRNSAKGVNGQGLKKTLESTRTYLSETLKSWQIKQKLLSSKQYVLNAVEGLKIGEKKDKVIKKAGELWQQGKKKWNQKFGQSQEKIMNKIGSMFGSLFGDSQQPGKQQVL